MTKSLTPEGTGHTTFILDNNYTRGSITIASAVDNKDVLPAAAVSSNNGQRLAVSVESCAIEGDIKRRSLRD